MPPTTAIPPFEARSLTKFYGAARGVQDISIAAGPGEIFGLLGPNGSGKTTVLRAMIGLLRPTRGRALLFGDPVRTFGDAHHERLGYLPADLRLWRGLTARRTSDLLGSIGSNRFDPGFRDELAERLDLDLDRRVKNLSLGNRQKIGLLLAFQHRPDLVILDEPTSGLDPLVRRTVVEILRELVREGKTIIYSSHNLNEVEQICSRVGILRAGRLVALKTIEEIGAERENRLEFSFAPGQAIPAELPPELSRFELRAAGQDTWQVGYHGSPAPLLRWLGQFEVTELHTPQISLEEAFLSYYREDPTSGGGDRPPVAQEAPR